MLEERVLNLLIMTEHFDLFLLLASKNVPHIFDKIFSGVGAVTLVNLSAASARHRDIVRSSRVAVTKIRSWRRMMEAPPRRRRILRTEPGADTPLVPCARVRGDTVMAAELSDKTTVRGWSLGEDRVTETITVEEHFPLPVFALDFDRAIVTVICADTGVPFSPGRRLVRIYCRRRRVLLSVCSPWPQHSLTALLLHNQWLVTAARDTSDLAVTSVRDPQLPAAAARLAHHRDPVLDLAGAGAGAALVTLSAAQLLVWTLGSLGPALLSAEIAVAKKCSRVSVSWPLAAVAVSDLGGTQVQVRT